MGSLAEQARPFRAAGPMGDGSWQAFSVEGHERARGAFGPKDSVCRLNSEQLQAVWGRAAPQRPQSFVYETRPGVCKGQPRNWPDVCLRMACELRMLFVFLKGYKNKSKEQSRICDRDRMWSAKPNVFPLWPFTEQRAGPQLDRLQQPKGQ